MEYVMLYLVDGILLLFLIATIIRCAHLGLARSLAGIIAWIAAAALALHFCAPLAEQCYDRFFHDRVLTMVEEDIQNAADKTLTVAYDSVLDDLPKAAVKAAESVGVDTEALQSHLEQYPHATAAAVEKDFVAPVVKAALKAAVFLLILVMIGVVLRLLLTPLGKTLHKIPVIGTTDHALGGVLGLLKGAVLIGVLSILLYVAAAVAEGEIARAIDNSRIVNFVTTSSFSNGLLR